MAIFKCCVGGCSSKSDTHHLFYFPKNDSLRSLWLFFIVPSNPELIGLSKDQLLRKRVCEKHFDRYQLDWKGKRLLFAYPCLFTDEEIAHGEPRPAPGTVHDVLSDHNYWKEQPDDDEEDLTGAELVIERAVSDDSLADAPSIAKSEEENYDNRNMKGKKHKRKPRTISNSSSSSNSDHGSTLWKRNKRQRKHSNSLVDKLKAKIKNLRHQLAEYQTPSKPPRDHSSLCLDPKKCENVYEDESQSSSAPEAVVQEAEPSDTQDNSSNFNDFELREPLNPLVSAYFLEQLKQLQLFGQNNWNSIHYSDVEKEYVHDPGFNRLEPNDEIKNYDTSRINSAKMETAFAGITYALLKQKHILQNELQGFLEWMQQHEQVTHSSVVDKLNEMFSLGEYTKVTNDIFHLVCSYRAELIQHRRKCIIASLKHSYHKNMFHQIPPTCSHLFDNEEFTRVLEKIGGVNAVFRQYKRLT